jgi:hypothetical protein
MIGFSIKKAQKKGVFRTDYNGRCIPQCCGVGVRGEVALEEAYDKTSILGVFLLFVPSLSRQNVQCVDKNSAPKRRFFTCELRGQECGAASTGPAYRTCVMIHVSIMYVKR